MGGLVSVSVRRWVRVSGWGHGRVVSVKSQCLCQYQELLLVWKLRRNVMEGAGSSRNIDDERAVESHVGDRAEHILQTQLR